MLQIEKTGHASYSTNNQHGSVRIKGNKVKLPKIGWVKLYLHRPLMENSTIKTVTINKTLSGKYYISILVEYENQIFPIMPKNFLGLDFAMYGLYVTSDDLPSVTHKVPWVARKSTPVEKV